MRIELDWEERQALLDILPDHIKEIKRGNVVHGDEIVNGLDLRVQVLEGILRKVED